ncbi:transmembrane protein 180-like [Tubulanus polymorphus]|uniref:transmembrane protein 180-like n=1 Tax=Tubulanus polymorphus TaxID=672921 RepID=UPI003DA59935
MNLRPITRKIPLGFWYGSLSFFQSMLHNLFLLYHIETFVSVYKIDKTSFWIGETIFLIWNSCNDPLFGWISDKNLLKTADEVPVPNIVQKRLSALAWNGPLYGLSFMTFWFEWAPPAIQFTVCLCLYDGFLTVIDLHHSALLADLAVSAEKRTRLNSFCSVFCALGSLSVFMSYLFWKHNNMFQFKLFCAILAVISMAGFSFVCKILRKYYIKIAKNEIAQNQDFHPVRSCDYGHYSQPVSKTTDSMKSFLHQLIGQKNFIWFALMNLIQVFHCHFNSNFFPLFLDNLVAESISPTAASILLGISFVAPHVNNLYFLSLCRKYGVYKVIQVLFLVKLVLCMIMFSLGPSHVWMLCLFIASNRVFTEGTCKLLNLVISDLVDEDYVIHCRQQAVSALMFGMTAFLSKPGQTFAPLIGTWLLSVQTGHDIFQSGGMDGSIKLDIQKLDIESKQVYKRGCFDILIYVPVACAVLQLIAWSKFTLHGKRLRWIKQVRAGSEHRTV